MDEDSRRLIDNVVKEDDVLNANITSASQFGLSLRPSDHLQILNASMTGARCRGIRTPSISSLLSPTLSIV